MVTRPKIVIVGNGMVGHKLVETLIERGATQTHEVMVFCEEHRLAYDRVNLSGFFGGKSADDLAMASPEAYEAAGVVVRRGERVSEILRRARKVRTSDGHEVPYDHLVLATGSYPFVPPVPGHELEGCFVYRTIEDLERIQDHAGMCRVGTVIGGGLLGLEAANALKSLGLEVHVVEMAPRLMALQLDDEGGQVLRARIEDLGVRVHCGASTAGIEAGEDTHRVSRLRFADGSCLDTDMVLFSAGIRPRDELARAAALEVGPRGGVAIDMHCRTSDPAIWAIGECASYEGRCYGLVAPGYHMARVVADAVAPASEGAAVFTGFDMSTKLKLLGVDVASFGDAFAQTAGAHVVRLLDSVTSVYKKLVVSTDRKTLLGGMLVGDAGNYAQLLQLVNNRITLPPAMDDLLLPPKPSSVGKGPSLGVDGLPPAAVICSCHNVDKGAICGAITSGKAKTVVELKKCTKAGSGCGSCVPLLNDLLTKELARAGVVVKNDLCEHFAHTRQELYHLVRVHRYQSFEALVLAHGRGHGCEICKPAVASILASAWNEHILADSHAPLQDTNDRFLANIQRDGTYSVVPRVPGGEITPDQLIALGQVAKKYKLYSKITGGQRVDLFGAQVDQLPAIWAELIAAGFESGHAYGKALRTVKSCVGSTWCRYGVQDSVGLAIRLENRYKGLRSPHKLKSAVSGCARECAEAQSKDFGVIATEKGYNLYVCGNGGMKPAHAQLLAMDLDETTLVRFIDRFLMFYIRTADRLQRTSTWFANLEGGLAYLKSVVVDDALGIAGELEAEMAHIVRTYACEWKAALQDPVKLRRFRSFVNTEAQDPSVHFVPEREQHRPARWDEKRAVIPVPAP